MGNADHDGPGIAPRSSLLIAIKRRLGNNAFRVVSQPVAAVLRAMPTGLLYDAGEYFRRNKPPYSLLSEGAVVVQIGAPRDLLRIGRSRTIYFLRLVGATGRVVVFEADRDSVAALRAYAAKTGLADRLHVVESAAWSERTTLSFRVSDKHPASNLVVGIDIPESEAARREYRTGQVTATTIDEAVARLRVAPTLVSITANGSERAILAGMQETIAAFRPFISLAFTGPDYPETMRSLGYAFMSSDDRGFTFAPVPQGAGTGDAASAAPQKNPTGK